MKKALEHYTVLIALCTITFLCILGLSSCTQAQASKQELPATGQIPSRGTEISGPRNFTRTISPGQTLQADSTDQHDLNIPLQSGDPVYPNDFFIGSLGKTDIENLEAEEAARSWLGAFISGQNPQERQTSSMIRSLGDTRRALGDISFSEFRIASGVRLDDGSLSFLVRLRGESHLLSAELLLIYQDGRWLVDDFISDGEARAQDEESRFDPFTYSRFL